MEENKIYCGDCIELMKQIEDKSVDMILCDLPYGTTACKWDIIIPFELLWEEYKRVIKENGVIVLFGQEPFSSYLRLSNIKMYKYDWVWEKSNPANLICAEKSPLKYHENVLVFYNLQPIYNKQMIERDLRGKNRIIAGQKSGVSFKLSSTEHLKGSKYTEYNPNRYDVNLKNPSTILKIKSERGKLHPTQKPVELFEYLIRTYTNEGDLVLDNCIGSGTTAVACKQTNRRFIGIDNNQEYVNIANKRLKLYNGGGF